MAAESPFKKLARCLHGEKENFQPRELTVPNNESIKRKKRLPSVSGLVVALLGGLVLISIIVGQINQPGVNPKPGIVELETAGRSPVSSARFSESINRPKHGPRVNIGNSQTVNCRVCHDSRKANRGANQNRALTEFHQHVSIAHGGLSCLSCHNEDNYDQLKLADGKPVEYRNVIELCSQCHAQQRTAFDHGAHGGMTGYWDLNRGPRQRNNCIDCHPAHRPKFPKMQPQFKPIDRFLEKHRQELP